MEKIAGSLREHFIICGDSAVAHHIAHELKATQRPYVVVTREDCTGPHHPDAVGIKGDPTDSETLVKAGLENARGLFAATGDDNINLVVSLTAKGINPSVKVIAECGDIKNTEKIKRAGADDVVSPGFIGGMRMASVMLRPTVVSFLDVMLRESGQNLRVEEVKLPPSLAGKNCGALNLREYPSVLLLAIRSGENWVYNPPADYVCKPQDILVVMTTPEARASLERDLSLK